MSDNWIDLISQADNEDIGKAIKFTIEIDKMTSILRRTLLTDSSRRENDAEHSWHIAVMALMFRKFAKQEPDILRACAMCVVHDLIEIYAGDTFAFDKSANLDKAKRELESADRLFAMLPEEEGKMIRGLWEEFEAFETVDSKYANCMDRVQPFIHNMVTEGHTWVEGKVTRADVEKRDAPIKEFMPDLWEWVEKNIDLAVKKGWILE